MIDVSTIITATFLTVQPTPAYVMVCTPVMRADPYILEVCTPTANWHHPGECTMCNRWKRKLIDE